jgi:hypothetical protein
MKALFKKDSAYVSFTSLSNQINDFLRENNIQKIIDIKYSSFKRDDNTNDYSPLLVYIGMSEE